MILAEVEDYRILIEKTLIDIEKYIKYGDQTSNTEEDSKMHYKDMLILVSFSMDLQMTFVIITLIAKKFQMTPLNIY